MKTIVFAIAMLASSLSFAGQRVFDCSATKLSTSKDLSFSEINIQQNPQVLFIDGTYNWSLQVGDVSLQTVDSNGPALWKESSSTKNTVRYDFWVEGSYEYELRINVKDHTAKVYWWGLGERVEVGTFACEVVEQ
ncbi:hypothetical protein QJS83_10570 [Bdellovibrio sp. 22V]|uniref:hypothetical protein n=1 Tax=Bdellovibrio TaxID=958 RepID=UPI0025436A9A|nr:hypothetical protein [Bdellovibrio sp. 22V]WII70904.1 hypothetical protein QJS83_10570 [Bdellovibrio sp. 22V]